MPKQVLQRHILLVTAPQFGQIIRRFLGYIDLFLVVKHHNGLKRTQHFGQRRQVIQGLIGHFFGIASIGQATKIAVINDLTLASYQHLTARHHPVMHGQFNHLVDPSQFGRAHAHALWRTRRKSARRVGRETQSSLEIAGRYGQCPFR